MMFVESISSCAKFVRIVSYDFIMEILSSKYFI